MRCREPKSWDVRGGGRQGGPRRGRKHQVANASSRSCGATRPFGWWVYVGDKSDSIVSTPIHVVQDSNIERYVRWLLLCGKAGLGGKLDVRGEDAGAAAVRSGRGQRRV
jgi:hypothetical protein